MLEFNGMEYQDRFAYILLKNQQDGFYLDIGANHYKNGNNTYVFEQMGWNGLAFDNSNTYRYQNLISDGQRGGPVYIADCEWEKRKAKYFLIDVTTKEFTQLLLDNLNITQIVDYISLDIDNNGINFGWKVLTRMINGGVRFKVMTFEHETYSQKNNEVWYSRALLTSLGYIPLFSNVLLSPKDKPFEDWWINPNYFDINIINCARENIYYKDCIKILESI